jgi:hypothetical protein
MHKHLGTARPPLLLHVYINSTQTADERPLLCLDP